MQTATLGCALGAGAPDPRDRRHRHGCRAASPLPATEVVVAQSSHAFRFGNIGFDFIGTGERRARRRRHTSSSPTSSPTSSTRRRCRSTGAASSRERGRPDTARLLRTARWFRERGVALKGHPLAWHTVQPRLAARPAARRGRATAARAHPPRGGATSPASSTPGTRSTRSSSCRCSTTATTAITPLARAKGRIPMVRLAFEEARAANPHATLLLNDFDLSSAYECLIEGVLEAGIQIDAIGLQTPHAPGLLGRGRRCSRSSTASPATACRCT